MKVKFSDYKDRFTHTDNGFCFKDDEAFETGEGICYIPEYEFREKDEEGNISGYTRFDILEICGGNVKLAARLYYSLDWQSPSTLFDEWDMHGELDKFCGKDGMIAETPEIDGQYLAVLDYACSEVVMIRLTDKEQKESEKYDTFDEYVWEVLSERYEFGSDDCHYMVTDNPEIRYVNKKENQVSGGI